MASVVSLEQWQTNQTTTATLEHVFGRGNVSYLPLQLSTLELEDADIDLSVNGTGIHRLEDGRLVSYELVGNGHLMTFKVAEQDLLLTRLADGWHWHCYECGRNVQTLFKVGYWKCCRCWNKNLHLYGWKQHELRFKPSENTKDIA